MQPAQHHLVFEAIGTLWSIDIFTSKPSFDIAQLDTQLHTRIAQFDTDYSRFRSDSLVMKMAHQPGKYTLPADAQPLFDLYFKLYTLSEGAFTPLIGNLLDQTGYDATYSFESLPAEEIQTVPSWENTLTYAFPHLEMLQPAILDFGAAGKGYLIDVIAEMLRQNDCQDFTIDGGGDIFHATVSNSDLEIGLENPLNTKEVIGTVAIHNQSLCASAGNRRKWLKYHHILNPYTKTSPTTVIASWVVAPTALVADAIATALFLVPLSKLKQIFEFEHAVLTADQRLHYSDNFRVKLY